LAGRDREEILSRARRDLTAPRVLAIARGDYAAKPESGIVGTGYCIASLEAALWCFRRTESFDAAVLAAANLGDDADTTAAITGQIAGAFYGVDAIPGAWRARLTQCERIDTMARELFERNRSRS
jgi:ADP-ribosyl-[dinitrogen reductase] hydrolase